MENNTRDELAHLNDVPLFLTATIPCDHLTVRELLALEPGSIVSTDRAAGESVDISVGGHTVAVGELIVIENSLAARLSDFGEKI
jgi:flagellar motor switch protein FliN/FliY